GRTEVARTRCGTPGWGPYWAAQPIALEPLQMRTTDATLGSPPCLVNEPSQKCLETNMRPGIRGRVVAEDAAASRGASKPKQQAGGRTVVHSAAVCSTPVSDRGSALWETWGKHRASGFRECFRVVGG